MKNPIQPLVKDSSGVLRFKENKIVQYVFDCGFSSDRLSLTQLDFTDDDRQHFAQLLGYSLSGYGELRYVSKADFRAAAHRAEGMDEREQRLKIIQNAVDSIREDAVDSVRKSMVKLIGLHHNLKD